MEPDVMEEGLERLETIQEELEEIRDRTANPRRSFVNGMLQGAGALVGGMLAIILFGWILSIMGFIPGLSDLASYLNSVAENFNRKH